MDAFRYSLRVLQIYSIRNVHYRYRILVVNNETQPYYIYFIWSAKGVNTSWCKRCKHAPRTREQLQQTAHRVRLARSFARLFAGKRDWETCGSRISLGVTA